MKVSESPSLLEGEISIKLHQRKSPFLTSFEEFVFKGESQSSLRTSCENRNLKDQRIF